MCLFACMKSDNPSDDSCIASNDDLVDNFQDYKQLVAEIRQTADLPAPSKGVFLPPGSPL